MYSDIEDLIESQPVDKTMHQWEQSTIEAEHIIKPLTVEGIFMGYGTNGIAALELNRKFIESTGLGVSEFFLRLMAWLCTGTDDYKNSQMVVVTGPNLSLAVKLMKRLKAIFSSKSRSVIEH